jgi:hypothetical protein
MLMHLLSLSVCMNEHVCFIGCPLPWPDIQQQLPWFSAAATPPLAAPMDHTGTFSMVSESVVGAVSTAKGMIDRVLSWHWSMQPRAACA